jgi:hypothetical protein
MIAVALKAPAHTLEFGQCPLHCDIVNTQFGRNGYGRQCIEHVVQSRQVQHHIQLGTIPAVAALHGKVHLPADRAHVGGPHLRFGIETISVTGRSPGSRCSRTAASSVHKMATP